MGEREVSAMHYIPALFRRYGRLRRFCAGQQIFLKDSPARELYFLERGKVRAYLLSRGVTIERDYTFFDGKHYDLIAGRRGGNDGYTDSELRFGRDNLLRPSAAFCEKIGKERAELRALAGTPMSNVSRRGILDRLNELEVVLDAIENDL